MGGAPSRRRLESIDLLRGLVMVLMALDHARDFFAGFHVDPTDPATTTAWLFGTRWVTHFCAPVFVFLAGTSAFLYGRRRSGSELSRFLLVRGLWLVLLELTIVRFAWIPDPTFSYIFLQVIWAIGISMVVLAALCRLPLVATAVVGVLLVAGHHLLEPITASSWGSLDFLWSLLHEPAHYEFGSRWHLIIAYPVLPWIGVMALGYCFGNLVIRPQHERRRLFLRIGLAAIGAFIVLRLINVYGDPQPWSAFSSPLRTLFSFMDLEKYPPSLLFILATLGPALCVLAWFERVNPETRPARWLLVFGRVPLFYYVTHLYLLHYTAIILAVVLMGTAALEPPPGPAGVPALGLVSAYIAWVAAVVILYPACRWFDRIKRERRKWWLQYL